MNYTNDFILISQFLSYFVVHILIGVPDHQRVNELSTFINFYLETCVISAIKSPTVSQMTMIGKYMGWKSRKQLQNLMT